ncbi:NFX1-type zinc finger-containing protein 1 [Diorhabda carinulata]|uniref:NFX1-type zinc finger-containing protein 1 n=1 Tax=Diorhabda carinulata TaxID=1163345 RepID=UPI0025A0AFED|nr:NFX1-type zinc finger-containing protein 1 [Diorhabda carinulata]
MQRRTSNGNKDRNQHSRSGRFNGRSDSPRSSNENSNKFASVSYLRILLSYNSDHILNILSKNKDEYFKVLNENNMGCYDLLEVITKITVKICESSFIANKYQILKITVSKSFVDAWKKQISNKPNLEIQYIDDILIIFENALDFMPSLCWYQIYIFIKFLNTTNICKSSSSLINKLNKLNGKVGSFKNRFSKSTNKNALAPEEDFHSITIFPSIKELVTREMNFIRSNVIRGSYESVSHYLDVLFRLQREDFLNPIREDICDHINGVDRHLFNIKIYNEVLFLGESCNKDDICYELQITLNKKLTERLNNETKNKFMTGSLLLFTDDNFKTVLKGLVVNSDAIGRGKLIVSFEENFPKLKHAYKMIECVVFFDPYYHVLKVLQMMEIDELPMGKYIVSVETTSTKRPAYLPLTTPQPKVKLNQSQEMAYKAAFSKEFVIIQGPPGTGKTFLGLTITKDLLMYSQGPILIVCYTNHALDQFLEGLLTDEINLVRLGSQSKNEKLQQHTLRRMKQKFRTGQMIKTKTQNIENFAANIKKLDVPLTILRNRDGIVGLKYLQTVLGQAFTEEYLFVWLLQDTTKYIDDSEAKRLTEVYWNYMKNTTNVRDYTVLLLDMEKWLSDISTSKSTVQLEIDSLNAEFVGGHITKEKYTHYMSLYEREMKCLEKDFDYIFEKVIFLTNHLDKKYKRATIQKLNDPYKLSTEARWELYQLWLDEAQEMLEVEKKKLLVQYLSAYYEFNMLKEDVDVATLKKMDIIGMTTSCAARMHSTLQRVECPIVIVEEAAEVLEAHIVTALSKNCQHLILLGDHQQLKPGTSDYVIGNQFNLGTSLFERMVENNIQCHTLSVQHRMRPEIASLITPVIYPNLKNSVSVCNYPEVRGMKKSLFFIHHKNPEKEFGDASKFNRFEAEYLVKLANYLLKTGYKSEEITILAAYAGQVVTINQEAAKIKNKDLKKVDVTTVDNFQGEENRIILLSLVRNNDEESVGFLKIENRICVALSRAKEGFYIMGNMRMLSNVSKIWKDIRKTLKTIEAIGRSLPLFCQNHGTVTEIEKIEDFENVSEGGCNKDCFFKLSCSHECKRKCHMDDLDHKEYKCKELCLRKICDFSSHDLCKKYCFEDCGVCQITVTVTLNCGHNQKVPCYKRKSLEKVECSFENTITLACSHEYIEICHKQGQLKQCNELCNKILKCGHKCAQICHYGRDTEHIDYKCSIMSKKIICIVQNSEKNIFRYWLVINNRFCAIINQQKFVKSVVTLTIISRVTKMWIIWNVRRVVKRICHAAIFVEMNAMKFADLANLRCFNKQNAVIG